MSDPGQSSRHRDEAPFVRAAAPEPLVAHSPSKQRRAYTHRGHSPASQVQASSLGPANTARVLQQMNNPDRALTCIQVQTANPVPLRSPECVQVAGTNGKGSVTHKLATALTQSGRTSGMFTSPHIGTVFAHYISSQYAQRPVAAAVS